MSSQQVDNIKEAIKKMPHMPGVYLMKDKNGKIIYVGKARDLLKRVSSYFQKISSLDIKTQRLVSTISALDFIVTENEVEALVLECNLIKEHKPKYNIRLKDDKKYPFLKLTLQEDFPRLVLVRRLENDGAEYYGPFTNVKSLRKMLNSIRTIFPLRNCKGEKPGINKGRECLNYYIGRCLAPCTGRINREEYAEIVEQVRLFLKGKNRDLFKKLERRMWLLSREKRYEEAAFVRDQLQSFNKVLERQVAVTKRVEDLDVVALGRENRTACCVVVKVREGKMLGSESFLLPSARADSDLDIYDSFIKLYYHSATDIPPVIYVQFETESIALLAEYLSRKTGRKVRFIVPKRGEKRGLLELAQKNAEYRVSVEQKSRALDLSTLKSLKESLHLDRLPRVIEAFDISNIHGVLAVGSMVTFKDGKPLKSRYRRFKVRSVQGIDDFAMMEEVLSRRFESIKAGKDMAPDLILIDGGKGQVSAAVKAMLKNEISSIPIIGLAKKEELVFMPGKKEGLRLERSSDALKLLQRLRDEAHRFAVSYHRKLRSKELQSSILDRIPGIGKSKRTVLLNAFGSVEKIKEASIDQLVSVPGIGDRLAEEIYRFIHKN